MSLKYNKVLGIGGIGVGMLFHTDINETLGRSESRLVELSEAKDYCKLHIVFHYIAELLSPDAKVYPIGYVGDDANGEKLIDEMNQAGMKTDFIKVHPKSPTVISICLQYPDKEGCNFTSVNGANEKVNVDYVKNSMEEIIVNDSSIVAAIPEVSVDSRISILKEGHEKGGFCVLSVPVSEAEEFKASGVFKYCDLLAVNEEEAIAIIGSKFPTEEIAVELYEYIKDYNSDMLLLITCGNKGAYSVSKGNIEFIPPMPVQVINTTGAGDACLGGTIAAIAMGIPFQKGINDSKFGQTPIASAVELGTLCAGMAIECEDSIAKYVSKKTILQKIEKENWEVEPWFIN